MLARVQTAAVLGIDAFPVAIEVDNTGGQTNQTWMVGLPDAAVKESDSRVRSALRNSGFRYPRGYNTINLAPANMRKEGSALDLPIALGLLAANRQIDGECLNHYAFVGELALDGSLRPVAGALAMAICARDQGLRGIVLPAMNADEAGVVQGCDVIPVHSLEQAGAFLAGDEAIAPHVTEVDELFQTAHLRVPDFSEVKGQGHVKRALTVAAAGAHNILMVGPV